MRLKRMKGGNEQVFFESLNKEYENYRTNVSCTWHVQYNTCVLCSGRSMRSTIKFIQYMWLKGANLFIPGFNICQVTFKDLHRDNTLKIKSSIAQIQKFLSNCCTSVIIQIAIAVPCFGTPIQQSWPAIKHTIILQSLGGERGENWSLGSLASEELRTFPNCSQCTPLNTCAKDVCPTSLALVLPLFPQ